MSIEESACPNVHEYLIDGTLSEEAVECRRNGYVLTGKFLGQGAYAKVYLGQAIPEKIQSNFKLKRMGCQDKEMKVAIKIISTCSAPEVYITKFLPREVSTMNRCYMHTNVIQLYDIFASHKRIYLVLEYAECGDLLTYVNHCYARKSENNCITEERAKAMFRDILAGVHFVHSRGVAHRDLKCENILLAKNRRAKLSDFGFAIQPTHNTELLKTHCGSYAYAPPEILKQQKYDGKLADLWSLGVILFAMVNGGLPFKESDAKAVLSSMRKPVYFKECLTADCKDLIRGLLKIRPHKRLSLPEIYAHSWMRKSSSHRHREAATDNADEISAGDNPHVTIPTANEERDNDLFDTPERVLNYIKERVIQGARYSKLSPTRNITEGAASRAQHERTTRTETLPKSIYLPDTTQIEPSEQNELRPKPKPAFALAQKNAYNSDNNHGKTSSAKRNLRLVEVQYNDDMVVTGASPNMALPQVPNNNATANVAISPNEKHRKEQSLTSPASQRKHLFKLRYEPKTPPTKPVAIPRTPMRADYEVKRTRFRGGRKTVDHLAKKHRSTTSPNVVNINIERSPAPLGVTTDVGLKMMQNLSVFPPHLTRSGATSVPPKPIAVRDGQGRDSLPSPQIEPVDVVPKPIRVGKDKSRNPETMAYNLTCMHNRKKKGIKPLSKKLILTIPEKGQQPDVYTEVVLSPERIAETTRGSGFKYSKPVARNRRIKTKQQTRKPSKYSALNDYPHASSPLKSKQGEQVYKSIYDRPGCAVAAWVGQQCATNNYTRVVTPGNNSTRYMYQNPGYYQEPRDVAGDGERNGRGSGKLLYRRSQTNRNILESISQSIHAPGLPCYRQPYTPVSRCGQRHNTNTSRQSPQETLQKPVHLRLSHLR